MHQRMHNQVLIPLQPASYLIFLGQSLYTNVSSTLAPMGHNVRRCGTSPPDVEDAIRFRLHIRRSHIYLVFGQRYHEIWKSVIR